MEFDPNYQIALHTNIGDLFRSRLPAIMVSVYLFALFELASLSCSRFFRFTHYVLHQNYLWCHRTDGLCLRAPHWQQWPVMMPVIRMELLIILINMTPDKYIYTAEVVPYTDIRLPFNIMFQKSHFESFFLAFPQPNEKLIFL